MEIHHVGLRVLGHTDHEAREGGATGTGCVVRDDDRPIDEDTPGDVDQQRPIHKGVVQEGEVVAGVVGDRAETGLTVLILGQRTNVDALVDERFIDLDEHHATVHTADQRGRLDVEPRHRSIAEFVCWHVTLEVELADQAVAPLLSGVVGALGRRKRLCSGRSTGNEPIGPAERTGGGGGKGSGHRYLSYSRSVNSRRLRDLRNAGCRGSATAVAIPLAKALPQTSALRLARPAPRWLRAFFNAVALGTPQATEPLLVALRPLLL